MANLFKYMSTAYAKIERETRIALQEESHSSAFADACYEYFGENFEITNESQRLKDLLAFLHQDTTQSLIQRLVAGEYIENCIEADNKELAVKPDLEEKLTLRVPEENDSEKEYKPVQLPVRGKLYESNKKKSERRKRQKARLASNSDAEASNNADNLMQSTLVQPYISSGQPNNSSLEDKQAALASHNLVIEDKNKADAEVIVEPAAAENIQEDITTPLNTIKMSFKESAATANNRKGAIESTISAPDPSHSILSHTTATATYSSLHHDFPNQCEDYPGLLSETAEEDNWTEVKGSRRRSKNSHKSSTNPDGTNASAGTYSSDPARRVNDQHGREKFVTPLAGSPNITRTSQTIAPQMGQAFNDSSLSVNESRSSGLKVLATAPPFPSTVTKNPWSNSANATPVVVNRSVGIDKQPMAKKSVGVENTAGSEQQAVTEVSASIKKPIVSEEKANVKKPVIKQKPVNSEQQTTQKQPAGAKTSASSKQASSSKNHGGQEEQAITRMPVTSEVQAVVTKTAVSKKTVVTKKTTVTQKTIVTEKIVVREEPNSTELPVIPENSSTNHSIISGQQILRPAEVETAVEEESNSRLGEPKPDTVRYSLLSTDSIDKSHHKTEERSSSPSSTTETIDPGTGPNFKFLKPFSKKAKKLKIYENMAPTTKLLSTNTTSANTSSLIESLRHAGVQDNALTSLAPRDSTIIAASTHYPVLNDGTNQQLAFPGRFLDAERANGQSTSADNSPVSEQAKQVVYHYPPPDILTLENQEILDLIIKGPPYPKYPRVPKLPSRDDEPLIPSEFITKEVSVKTYDGKDIYEVLGDRCPAQLTIQDHPHVNKCIQAGQIFHCAYCQAEISGTAAAEDSIVCPGCGPCSDIRYCQRSHLAADSLKHFEICGKKTDTYPLLWSKLPLHYQSLYPYIKPTTGTMTAECFRQMAHCLVINSDGIIQHPFKAYFETKMPEEAKVKTQRWVTEMYPFQDQGLYYLFHPSALSAGVDIDTAIGMPDGSGGLYREDQRFARARNAAFLTRDPALLCVLYRRLQDALLHQPDLAPERRRDRLGWLERQFAAEFPGFDGVARGAPLRDGYCFQTDWALVRDLVADLELANPVLRVWITGDAEDDGVPVDPTRRWQGRHWGVVVGGPTFRAGSVDRRDWGLGWYGGGPLLGGGGVAGEHGEWQLWMKELDRKYFNMVLEELAKVEMERDGNIV